MITTNDVLLNEMQGMRSEMNTGFRESLQLITALETQIKPLFGNGQPGVIDRMQTDIQDFKLRNAKHFGWFAGVMASVEIVYHLVTSKLVNVAPHLPFTH